MKILYINGGIMNRGGIESYMMNYFRNIDKELFHIDFLVHGYEKGAYDDEILSLGGKIFQVPVKSKHPILYKKELSKIFIEGKYDIVHSHIDAMSCVVLKIAKDCGVKVRVAHSHNTKHLTDNKAKYFLNEIARKNITRYTTHCCACSNLAGKWLFGDHKFKLIYNAIEIEKYIFNSTKRTEIRNSLNILPEDIVFGHVGRFDTQKNHEFLINVFSKIKSSVPNSKLLLVGDGWKIDIIKKMVGDLNLSNSVIFLGGVSNVEDIYNVMDCFVFPSLFEGLGIVLIEAQVNGLKSVVSEYVPKEVNVSDSIQFLPLCSETWLSEIEKISDYNRLDLKDKVKDNGYEINSATLKLENYYLEITGV